MADYDDEDGRSDGSGDSQASETVIGVYKGDRLDGNPLGARHGKGQWTAPNKDEYIGDYMMGKRSGEGSYLYAVGLTHHTHTVDAQESGAKYEGAWEDGLKHGKGTMHWADGSLYDGEWVRGKRHGPGVYTYPNGDHYEGEWEDGKKNGTGTYTFGQTGSKYVGEWVDGRRHGEAMWHHSDGTLFHGSFVRDQPLGKGTFIFPRYNTQQEGEYVERAAEKEEEDEEDEEAEEGEDLPKKETQGEVLWLGGEFHQMQ